MSKNDPAERTVRDIRRKTRKQYTAEEKIRIVVSGLRGEVTSAKGRAEGIRVLPVPVKRGRVSPLTDLRTIAALWRLYRAERPDVVHHVAMKPVLYGAIAARLTGVPAAVGALTGLGYVFSSRDIRARLLRPLLRRALRWALNGRRSICLTQNPDDAAFVAGLGVDRRRIVVIPGSGVDTVRFAPSPEPDGPVRATLVSRMLWDKGVGEFVEAARVARARNPALRFTLIGAPDEDNPAAVPVAKLEAWRAEGVVDWQGRRDDIPTVWKDSHIAVVPSYREGLPKTLLDAASCGRPIVAADVPGSREIARDGESALLVPPRDPAALAAAILRLADDLALRARLGAGGRRLVEREFSEERIAAATLALWRRLLAPPDSGR